MEERDQQVSLKALVVLSRSYRSIVNLLEKDVQKYGLNITQFAVLELLYHKGEQPIQRIGEKILITSGSITYVVDKLEKIGYLKRKRCESDRRVIYATLTSEGKQFMDQVFPEHATFVQQLFSPLNEEEKKQLITSLKKLGIPASAM